MKRNRILAAIIYAGVCSLAAVAQNGQAGGAPTAGQPANSTVANPAGVSSQQQGTVANPAGVTQQQGTVANPAGAPQGRATVANPAGTPAGRATVVNPAGVLSTDEKAALWDKLSPRDQMSALQGATGSGNNLPSSPPARMTNVEKASAFDRLPADQQNRLMPERPFIGGPADTQKQNPNDPNVRDGETPAQTRNPRDAPAGQQPNR